MAARRRVTKIDGTKPKLVVENGKVVEVPLPVLEETVIEETEGENPRWEIQTANGTAVYEYAGDCWDCKNEGRTVAVFKCTTNKITAHAEIGNQLAGFVRDGDNVTTVICQDHYQKRFGGVKPAEVYKVIERRY